MIRRPPRSTQGVSSAASDVYKRQVFLSHNGKTPKCATVHMCAQRLAHSYHFLNIIYVYIKWTHDAKRTVHMRALFFSAAGEADTYFCPMSQVADVLSSTLVKPLRNPSSVGVRACLHECLNMALLAQRWSNHCRQHMATLVEKTAEAQLVRQLLGARAAHVSLTGKELQTLLEVGGRALRQEGKRRSAQQKQVLQTRGS